MSPRLYPQPASLHTKMLKGLSNPDSSTMLSSGNGRCLLPTTSRPGPFILGAFSALMRVWCGGWILGRLL